MVANPCCMPLKVGVKIITHLSMALAVAVGFMGIRLISISLEVTTNPTFQQQHLNTLLLQYNQQQNEKEEILWRANSNGMMKRGLIYPQDDFDPPDGLSPDSHQHFLQQYAKSMLVSGLMAVSAVFFQFLCSCLLLCFINWEGKSPTQIWVAVNCSILFCLATCLVLFLCEGRSVPAYSTDEKLFLALVTADTLLSIYFLWIVMAFI